MLVAIAGDGLAGARSGELPGAKSSVYIQETEGREEAPVSDEGQAIDATLTR